MMRGVCLLISKEQFTPQKILLRLASAFLAFFSTNHPAAPALNSALLLGSWVTSCFQGLYHIEDS